MPGDRPAWALTVARIRERAREHHELRAGALNFGAAETITSDVVRELLASDFGRRYSTPTGAYSGAEIGDEIESTGVELARHVFGARFATLQPISGHLAVLAALVALTEPGDTVMTTAPADGGYPLTLAPRMGLRVVHHAFDSERQNLDLDGTRERILRERPRLIMFGASEYLFAHPVAELAEAAHAVGAIVCYDGAHPLGLIAGGAFHDPLADGADVLLGSTNKTFFGPHRGIILVRDDETVFERLQAAITTPPVLQSTHHTNTAVALAVALAETAAFGAAYAAAVVANARALAQALDRHGVPVLAIELGGTTSHQVIIPADGFCAPGSVRLQRRLAAAGILADCVVRFGTQQVTRLGMGAAEMDVVGDLVARLYHDESPAAIDAARRIARELAHAFQAVGYSFEAATDAFRYVPFVADRLA